MVGVHSSVYYSLTSGTTTTVALSGWTDARS